MPSTKHLFPTPYPSPPPTQHGLKKFFTWFDHTAWYPIGRPVGTTIYPGMQLTSVFIWHVLHRLNKIIPGVEMSLNDICVFMPTWFGSIASLVTGFLAAGEGCGGVVGCRQKLHHLMWLCKSCIALCCLV